MCTAPSFPKINYGQGSGAWNPASRDPVYQKIEQARRDMSFASGFASDILYGKYNDYYTSEAEQVQVGATAASGEGNVEPIFETRYNPKLNSSDRLRRENSLNASKSWVQQAFDAPAIKGDDGKWYQARAYQSHQGDTFFRTNNLIGGQTERLLNEGHFAFTAKGKDGTEVFVPYAQGYLPAKGTGGAPEAGNRKADRQGNASAREQVSAGMVAPMNVLGGGQTLLAGGANNQRKRTLLGG